MPQLSRGAGRAWASQHAFLKMVLSSFREPYKAVSNARDAVALRSALVARLKAMGYENGFSDLNLDPNVAGNHVDVFTDAYIQSMRDVHNGRLQQQFTDRMAQNDSLRVTRLLDTQGDAFRKAIRDSVVQGQSEFMARYRSDADRTLLVNCCGFSDRAKAAMPAFNVKGVQVTAHMGIRMSDLDARFGPNGLIPDMAQPAAPGMPNAWDMLGACPVYRVNSANGRVLTQTDKIQPKLSDGISPAEAASRWPSVAPLQQQPRQQQRPQPQQQPRQNVSERPAPASPVQARANATPQPNPGAPAAGRTITSLNRGAIPRGTDYDVLFADNNDDFHAQMDYFMRQDAYHNLIQRMNKALAARNLDKSNGVTTGNAILMLDRLEGFETMHPSDMPDALRRVIDGLPSDDSAKGLWREALAEAAPDGDWYQEGAQDFERNLLREGVLTLSPFDMNFRNRKVAMDKGHAALYVKFDGSLINPKQPDEAKPFQLRGNPHGTDLTSFFGRGWAVYDFVYDWESNPVLAAQGFNPNDLSYDELRNLKNPDNHPKSECRFVQSMSGFGYKTPDLLMTDAEDRSGLAALRPYMSPKDYKMLSEMRYDGKPWCAACQVPGPDGNPRTQYMSAQSIERVRQTVEMLMLSGENFTFEPDFRPGQVRIKFDNGMTMRVIDPQNEAFAGNNIYYNGATMHYQVQVQRDKSYAYPDVTPEMAVDLVKFARGERVERRTNLSERVTGVDGHEVPDVLGIASTVETRDQYKVPGKKPIKRQAAYTNKDHTLFNTLVDVGSYRTRPDAAITQPDVALLINVNYSSRSEARMCFDDVNYQAKDKSIVASNGRMRAEAYLQDCIQQARRGFENELNLDVLIAEAQAARLSIEQFEAEGGEMDEDSFAQPLNLSANPDIAAIQSKYWDVLMGRQQTLLKPDYDSDDYDTFDTGDVNVDRGEHLREHAYQLESPEAIVRAHMKDLEDYLIGDYGPSMLGADKSENIQTVGDTEIFTNPYAEADEVSTVHTDLKTGMRRYVDPETGEMKPLVRFNPILVNRYMSGSNSSGVNSKNIMAACKAMGFTVNELKYTSFGTQAGAGLDFQKDIAKDKLVNYDPRTAQNMLTGEFGSDGQNAFMRGMGETILDSLRSNGCMVNPEDIKIDANGIVRYHAERIVGSPDGNPEPFDGEIGKIYAPRDDGLVKTSRFIAIPGYSARVEPNKPGENKPYEQRMVLTSYEMALKSAIRNEIRQNLTSSAPRVDDRPITSGMVVGESFSLDQVLRDFVDIRYPLYFDDDKQVLARGMSVELRDQLIKDNANKVKLPKEFMQASNEMLVFNALNGNESDRRDVLNDRCMDALVLSGYRNVALLESPGDGIFDPYATGNANAQGVRYLVEGAKIDETGHIIPAEDKNARCSLVNYMIESGRYPTFDSPDRMNMSLNGLRHCIRETEAVGVAQVTCGLWTLDDGLVVTKEFADNNKVPIAHADLIVDEVMQLDITPDNADLERFGFDLDAVARGEIDYNDPDTARAYAVAYANAMQAEMSYADLEMNPAFADPEFDFEDFDFSGFDGVDPSSDEYKAMMARVFVERSLLPGDKIECHGNKGVIGIVIDPEMPESAAKDQKIDWLVDLYKKNPDLQVVMSSYSGVSRFNAGLAVEAINSDPQDLILPDGTVHPKSLGHVHMTVLEQTADTKTHFDKEGGDGRAYGAQMTWALSVMECSEVMKDSFRTNFKASSNLREMMMAMGLDVDPTGRFQMSYQPHPDEQRNVFELPEIRFDEYPTRAKNGGGWPVVRVNADEAQRLSGDFAEWLNKSGGFMELPFPLEYPGKKTLERQMKLNQDAYKAACGEFDALTGGMPEDLDAVNEQLVQNGAQPMEDLSVSSIAALSVDDVALLAKTLGIEDRVSAADFHASALKAAQLKSKLETFDAMNFTSETLGMTDEYTVEKYGRETDPFTGEAAKQGSAGVWTKHGGTNTEPIDTQMDTININGGQKTYVLPVMSSYLRAGQEFGDGELKAHDYTRHYVDIYDKVIQYQKAKFTEEWLQANLRGEGGPKGVNATDAEKAAAKAEFMQTIGKIAANKKMTVDAVIREKLDTCMKEQKDARAGAQSAYNKITHDLEVKRFSGKRNIFRSSIMSNRQSRSCTAIWTPDPRLSVDEIGMSPAMAQALDLKEGDYTLLHRDPVLRGSGIRYMQVKVDPNLVGISVHPAGVPKGMDGDFDGDTGGLHNISAKDRAARNQAYAKLSVSANLLDSSATPDEEGNLPLFIATGQDVNAGMNRNPQLKEDLANLTREVNQIERDYKDNPRELNKHRREAIGKINKWMSDVSEASMGADVISYADKMSNVRSNEAYVRSGAKGKLPNLDIFARNMGCVYERDEDGNIIEDTIQVHDENMAPREMRSGVLKAKNMQQQYTGAAGSATIQYMTGLTNLAPNAATQAGYGVAQGTLQVKHDPEKGMRYELLLETAIKDLRRGVKLCPVQRDVAVWDADAKVMDENGEPMKDADGNPKTGAFTTRQFTTWVPELAWTPKTDENGNKIPAIDPQTRKPIRDQQGNVMFEGSWAEQMATREDYVKQFDAIYNSKDGFDVGLNNEYIEEIADILSKPTKDGTVMSLQGEFKEKFAAPLQRCAYGGTAKLLYEMAYDMQTDPTSAGLFDVPTATKEVYGKGGMDCLKNMNQYLADGSAMRHNIAIRNSVLTDGMSAKECAEAVNAVYATYEPVVRKDTQVGGQARVRKALVDNHLMAGFDFGDTHVGARKTFGDTQVDDGFGLTSVSLEEASQVGYGVVSQNDLNFEREVERSQGVVQQMRQEPPVQQVQQEQKQQEQSDSGDRGVEEKYAPRTAKIITDDPTKPNDEGGSGNPNGGGGPGNLGGVQLVPDLSRETGPDKKGASVPPIPGHQPDGPGVTATPETRSSGSTRGESACAHDLSGLNVPGATETQQGQTSVDYNDVW